MHAFTPVAMTRTARGLVALAALLLAACSQPEARATSMNSATSADTLSDSALVTRADVGRTTGADDAPIWVVMISDFQCPYCKQFHDAALKEFMREYVVTGKARFAYLHLPLQQHPHARPAARASLCASAQGKFWEYADGVFEMQERLGGTVDAAPLLDDLARRLSLDMPEFAHCRRSAAIDQVVQSDINQATRAGVQSTPSFFVGEFLIAGNAPYATFRGAVDSALVLAARKRAR
jgi:protein-disulfide isomerase